MREYVPDSIDIFNQYDAERQKEIDRLPVCEFCDRPIMDEYCYNIDGTIICEECLKEHFRVDVESLIE